MNDSSVLEGGLLIRVEMHNISIKSPYEEACTDCLTKRSTALIRRILCLLLP